MDKISEDFSNVDMQKAMQLAQSDAAKQLFAMLRSENSHQLNVAMRQASAGDISAARDTLQQLLATEQAQNLLRHLQGE